MSTQYLDLSAIAACAKKVSLEEGWEFFPQKWQHQSMSVNPEKYDFTITPTGEKGWTTGKE